VRPRTQSNCRLRPLFPLPFPMACDLVFLPVIVGWSERTDWETPVVDPSFGYLPLLSRSCAPGLSLLTLFGALFWFAPVFRSSTCLFFHSFELTSAAVFPVAHRCASSDLKQRDFAFFLGCDYATFPPPHTLQGSTSCL